jgi:hypothetical protein
VFDKSGNITFPDSTVQTTAYTLGVNANIGTLYLGNISTQANIGAIYNHINTLDANVGAFETYANTNLTTTNLVVSNVANVTYANIPGTATTGVYGLAVGAPNAFYPNTTAGFTANVNNYSQLTIQNLNSGAAGTSDFIATADNGSNSTNYIDLGIINSGYNNSNPSNSLGNIVYNGDGYLYAQGNLSTTFGGNLAIGTTTAGKVINLFAGGIYANAIAATISNTTISTTTMLKINYVGSSDSSIVVAGYDSKGGTGYHDFLHVQNGYSGATNPSKYFRLDSTGNLQILNSGYTATVLQVTDSGLISTGGASTTSNSIPTSNAITLNNNGLLFDDGNFHLHSSSGAIWINPLDSTNVEIGTQYNSGSGAGIVVQGGVTTNTTNPASHSFFPKVQTNWNVNQPSLAMDNLNVRLYNSSGNSLLIEASAVSGTFNAYITTCEMVAGYSIGSQTNSSGITFTAGTWTSINAIHTLSSGGDVIVATVSDTTNGRIYRVTCIHTNGATNGSIFIERMV